MPKSLANKFVIFPIYEFFMTYEVNFDIFAYRSIAKALFNLEANW